MSEEHTISSESVPPRDDLTLAEVLYVLRKRKALVFGLPLLVAVLVGTATLFVADSYKTDVQIVTSKEAPGAVLLTLVQSDQVRDRIVKKLDLAQRFGTNPGRQTDLEFKERVTAKVAKDGILAITVSGTDPEFAARLADAVAQESIQAVHEGRLSSASMNIDRYRTRLAQVRRIQNQFVERLGALGQKDWEQVLSPDDRGLVVALSDVNAELSIGNINSDIVQGGLIAMQDRLLNLDRQLAERRATTSKTPVSPEVFDAVKELYFLAALEKRLERIIENSSAELRNEIKVVAPAPVPLIKDKPKRALIVMASTIVALFFTIFLAFVSEFSGKAAWEPQRVNRTTLPP